MQLHKLVEHSYPQTRLGFPGRIEFFLTEDQDLLVRIHPHEDPEDTSVEILLPRDKVIDLNTKLYGEFL